MSDIYTYYMAQIIGSAGNGDRKGVSGSYGRSSPYVDDFFVPEYVYVTQRDGSVVDDSNGTDYSYGRNKFSPSSTGQIFTYSVFDEGYVDTDAVGKGWFVTDSCGVK